ncbi:MAG: GNAT family N-acetyltransferase [Candidatus Marinimicrobia bacterium]|nr:GNAT family N-acetyltransferase [Candidatus Neomarinimicrobiota bacterium]
MIKIPKLSTERLILRRFEASDAADVQRLAGAREIAATTLNIPHPYEDGLAESWIASHEEGLEKETHVVFAMIRAREQDLIGAIGLNLVPKFQRAELGYWVGKSFWGRGFATEAAFEMLRYGFEDLQLNRIHATHMTHNPASGAVMKKIGMKHEGIQRQHALKWDKYVDLSLYGILSKAWRKNQNL